MGKWRDMFGRAVRPTPEPEKLTRRVVVASVRDREDRAGILGDVTPGKLRGIFADADEGNVAAQVELAQTIRERDDHVACVDAIRRAAVLAVDLMIEPGDGSAEARLAADAFRSEWEVLGHRQIRERMMDAILDQWSIQEVIWTTDGMLGGRRHWAIEAIEEVDARKLCWPFRTTTTPGDLTHLIPGIMRDWNPAELDALEPGKFLWLAHQAKRGRPGRGALVRCVAALWMFKRFAFIDLAQLLEQWGRPWPLIKYDPNVTPEQVRGWLEQLADSMADRVLAIPAGSEAQVVPAATGADAPHINMIDLCNKGISKIFVGSTTIAEAAQNAESVSSPTHAAVREDIRNSDAYAVAWAIRECLAVPWTLWNFGPNVAPPKITPNLTSKPDPAKRATVYEAAARIGLAVKSEQVYADLAIEAPKGVKPVLLLGATGVLGGPLIPRGKDAKADIDLPDDMLPEQVQFLREVFRGYLADGTVNDAMFNLTNIRELMRLVNVPVQGGYEEPWMPVRDDTGALVSGDTVKDKSGAIVGGQVIPGSAPAAPGMAGLFGATAPRLRLSDAGTEGEDPTQRRGDAEGKSEKVET